MKRFVVGLILGVLIALPTGAFAAGYIDGADIKDYSITKEKLGTAIINTVKIADGGVRYNDLARKSVGNKQLIDNSIGYKKLRSGSVNSYKIRDNAVTSDKLRDGAVNSQALRDGAVMTDKIGNGTVNTDKIADGSIRLSDLSGEVRNKLDEPKPKEDEWVPVKSWTRSGGLDLDTEPFVITSNDWRIIYKATASEDVAVDTWKNGVHVFNQYIYGRTQETQYYTAPGEYTLVIGTYGNGVWTVIVEQKV